MAKDPNPGAVALASGNHGENRPCAGRKPPNSAFKKEDPFLKWEAQNQFPKERNLHGNQGYRRAFASDKSSLQSGGAVGRTHVRLAQHLLVQIDKGYRIGACQKGQCRQETVKRRQHGETPLSAGREERRVSTKRGSGALVLKN